MKLIVLIAAKIFIMAMTGHKTTQMVRRYIQEANLFKNNALNKIFKREKYNNWYSNKR